MSVIDIKTKKTIDKPSSEKFTIKVIRVDGWVDAHTLHGKVYNACSGGYISIEDNAKIENYLKNGYTVSVLENK